MNGGDVASASSQYYKPFLLNYGGHRRPEEVKRTDNRENIMLPEKLLEEAAQWHARITDDAASEDVWLSFTLWLEQGSQHQAAYDQVEMLAEQIDELASSIKASLLKANDQTSGSNKAVGKTDGNIIQAGWRWQTKRAWGGLAAAAAVVMVVFSNIGMIEAPKASTEEYFTAIGEQRLVKLADGSTIHLNTNSKLFVTLSQDTRRTRLEYGEAVFSVSKDKTRPFFVELGDQQVRVVGTKFNIFRNLGSVIVTVAEGIVDVSSSMDNTNSPNKPAAVRLWAGKQLVHTIGSTNDQINSVEAEVFLTWEDGILEFEDSPLPYIFKKLERYFNAPIVLNGDFSNITFSGLLNVRNRSGILALLEDTLPIQITQTPEVITVSPAD